MELSFEMIQSELYVYFSGELDHHSAKGIGEKIDFEIVMHNPKRVCLDFEKMSFMDSSGLAVIMGRRKTCLSIGAQLYISGISGAIKKVLFMSGIQKYVKVKENIYESK